MSIVHSTPLYTFRNGIRVLVGARIAIPGCDERTIITRAAEHVYEKGAFPGHYRRVS